MSAMAVDAAQVEAFVASLKRCLAKPGFLEDFYQAFVGSSEEVREKFRNTDFERQTRMLADSLIVLAVAAQGQEGSPARGDLPRIARRHGRGDLDIRPALYDVWLDCLLATAGRYDPDFSPEIGAAWRSTLAGGIEYMRSRY
jgi:hemoglobin-like flavoprotein